MSSSYELFSYFIFVAVVFVLVAYSNFPSGFSCFITLPIIYIMYIRRGFLIPLVKKDTNRNSLGNVYLNTFQ